MGVETRNLSPQILMKMASGMTTMEIHLDNLYVSITQVQNTNIHMAHSMRNPTAVRTQDFFSKLVFLT